MGRKNVKTIWKAVIQFLKKQQNKYLPCDPVNEDICSHKSLYMNVHHNVIYNINKLKTTEMSFNRIVFREN